VQELTSLAVGYEREEPGTTAVGKRLGVGRLGGE
jgi:hypothetical protein